MESTLLLVRVWQLPLSDGTRVFRACVNRVADREAAFFDCVDALALYLQRCASGEPAGSLDARPP